MKHLVHALMFAVLFAAPVMPVMAAPEGAHHTVDMDAVVEQVFDDPEFVEHSENEAAHHGDAHHEEIKGLPQLDPTWYPSQIFWLAVTFALMYLPFRFKILPDLSSVIERRSEKIDGDLTAAKRFREEAEETHAAYEAILAEARDESSALFIRAEEKIKAKSQEEFQAFYKHATKLIEETEAEILAAKDNAIGEMNDIAAEVAATAAEALVGIKTDKQSALSIIKNIEKKKAA